MQNTVYILIKSDYYSIQLLEKILIMLVGGYTLKCHRLQLVVIDMIDDGNTENKSNFSKMSEISGNKSETLSVWGSLGGLSLLEVLFI